MVQVMFCWWKDCKFIERMGRRSTCSYCMAGNPVLVQECECCRDGMMSDCDLGQYCEEDNFDVCVKQRMVLSLCTACNYVFLLWSRVGLDRVLESCFWRSYFLSMMAEDSIVVDDQTIPWGAIMSYCKW